MSKSTVITRFPPSPTGFLHIGRARTALFNYLFAKQNGGKMIFRFEDTDKIRSKKEFEDIMSDSLRWLGISWDNDVIERQSERTDLYKKYLHKLVADNKAYISKEKIQEGEKAGQENEIVRFRNPNTKLTFTDLIRGDITFDTTELGDFIIARNIDEPLYHLAVVVDDFEMKVTHIIRGEDGISNTPRQILIQQGIGAARPIYAHLPLILASDRSKLSGRHGAVSVTEYKDKGYLPEALINYLALLGWNPGTDREIFTLDELVKEFDITKVQKGGAIFNETKLRWFNKEYLKKLPHALDLIEKEIKKTLPDLEDTVATKISPLILERIDILSDVKEIINSGEFSYFLAKPEYEVSALNWKTEPNSAITKSHLEMTYSLFKNESDFTAATLKNLIWKYAEEKGRGNVLWPIRFALSGKAKSPDPFVLAELLGKDTTLSRIERAINKLT